LTLGWAMLAFVVSESLYACIRRLVQDLNVFHQYIHFQVTYIATEPDVVHWKQKGN
jgi:hypothetical protein